MHAEDFLINNGSHRQTVEAICKYLPQTDTETALALIIEPIDSVDRSTFMVSPKEEKVVWKFYLVSQEETYSLYTLLSSVHIVSKKQVVGFRWKSTILKQPKKV